MAKGGTGFGCSLFLVYKTELSAFPPKRTPPLLFQRCLASLLPFPLSRSPLLVFQPSLFSKTLAPPLVFQPSPLFKNSSPPFAAASKGSGAAACAWGAGDTKPGQPALLPCLRCSPLLRVSGNGMHMGEWCLHYFGVFFLFFLFIFYFCGDPKMGYNSDDGATLVIQKHLFALKGDSDGDW